jgi:hypothetical protein
MTFIMPWGMLCCFLMFEAGTQQTDRILGH